MGLQYIIHEICISFCDLIINHPPESFPVGGLRT